MMQKQREKVRQVILMWAAKVNTSISLKNLPLPFTEGLNLLSSFPSTALRHVHLLSQLNLLTATSLPLLPTDKYHWSYWEPGDLLMGTLVVAVKAKQMVTQSPLQGFKPEISL